MFPNYKTFIKSKDIGNTLPQYTDDAKSKIVSQYTHMINSGFTSYEASNHLSKLHDIHTQTLKIWSRDSRYALSNNTLDDIKISKYKLTQNNHKSIPKQPAYAVVENKVQSKFHKLLNKFRCFVIKLLM